LESVPGIGSKFSFTLKFDISSEPDNSYIPLDTSHSSQGVPVFKGSVLVCEDNAMNQTVIDEHLRRIGLDPVIVENGKLGVDSAVSRMDQGNPFDLILMDVHMPVMDGLEAAQELSKRGNKTPIVALTANIMTQDMELYQQHGITEYLSKPFAAQDLWNCLLKFLKPLKFLENAGSRVPAPAKISQETSSSAPSDSSTDIINYATGLKMASGNQQLYDKLKRNFYKSNQNVFEEINAAIQKGDITLAHRMAHTLKSVAAIIGAEKLRLAAYTIELSLAKGKQEYTGEQMQVLGKALEEVFELLRSSDPDGYADGHALGKPAPATALHILRPVCSKQ
jgi:CheY-like chemotaxis protein